MPDTTTRHPGIYKAGRVYDDGHTTVITGWTLGLCDTACSCHRTTGGHMVIHQDTTAGTLGLRQYRTCDCCTPWTADELAAAADDLDYLARPTTSA